MARLDKKYPLTKFRTFLEARDVAPSTRAIYLTAFRQALGRVDGQWQNFTALRDYYRGLPRSRRAKLAAVWRHWCAFSGSELPPLVPDVAAVPDPEV